MSGKTVLMLPLWNIRTERIKQAVFIGTVFDVVWHHTMNASAVKTGSGLF
ncbi:hypothetical protein [Gluconobacter cerinus]|nr:hypothetical protein [Gluconobacter cerinus]MBS1069742.1 hypothetical protein [Gluconobacter cerinus]